MEEEELEERECEPSDGYYEASNFECMSCSIRCKTICKLFSYINGYQSEDILYPATAIPLEEEE